MTTKERDDSEQLNRGPSSGSGKKEKEVKAAKDRYRRSGSGSSGDKRKGLRIFVGTVNLSQAIPDEESLAAFLPHRGKVAYVLNSDVKSSAVVDGVSKRDFNKVDKHGKIEVIVLGFQECLPNPVSTGLSSAFGGLFNKNKIASADVRAGNTSTAELDDMINSHIGEDYTLMMERLHSDMLMHVYVRKDLASSSSITDTHVQSAGVGGSKGFSIASTLNVDGTKLSFICMQLKDKVAVPMKTSTITAAKKANLDQKNATAEEFLNVAGNPSVSSHHVFVFGDLNYLISPPSNTRGVKNTKEEEQYIARNMLNTKQWSAISACDELVTAMKKNDAFSAFSTPFCKFHPTYKVHRAAGIKYDYTNMPSYTDRILWRSNQEGRRKVEAIVYEPIPQFSCSDHKPMRGLFFLPNNKKLHFDEDNQPQSIIITFTHLKAKKLRPKEDVMHSDINPYLQFVCGAKCVKLSKSSKNRTETQTTTDRPTWPTTSFRYKVDLSSSERNGDEIERALLHIKCMNEGIRSTSQIGTAVLDLANIISKSVSKKEWEQKEAETYFYSGGRQTGKLYYNIKVRWGD